MTELNIADQKTKQRTIRPLTFRFLLPLAIVLLILMPVTLRAEIYRWKDSNGRLHFSDSLQQVPEQFRPKSEWQQNSTEINVISKPKRDASAPATTSPPTSKEQQQTLKIPYVDREGSASRVIVNIRFNNQVTAPILVDTGSPGLILDASLARRLGLLNAETNNLLVLIGGIGGTQIAARTIVEEVSVGPIKENVIPAHIIEDHSEAYHGLIGMDILAGYSLTIDTANKCLVATKQPPSDLRPGGHDQRWWQRNFHELLSYINFWEQQVDLLDSGDPRYSRLSSQFKDIKKFMSTQLSESQRLYQRLDRHARSQRVPRHWRK